MQHLVSFSAHAAFCFRRKRFVGVFVNTTKRVCPLLTCVRVWQYAINNCQTIRKRWKLQLCFPFHGSPCLMNKTTAIVRSLDSRRYDDVIVLSCDTTSPSATKLIIAEVVKKNSYKSVACSVASRKISCVCRRRATELR